MPKTLVLVTGPPGAGKSTLAPGLAAALDMSLVMKDTIKEAIHDGLGRPNLNIEQSRRLGGATFEVMWAVARHIPQLVLECNFDKQNQQQMKALRDLHPSPIEVFCACPPEVAAERYSIRHQRGERHPVHVVEEIPAQTMAMFRPLALGPVVSVDTTRAVDVQRLATEVRRLAHAHV